MKKSIMTSAIFVAIVLGTTACQSQEAANKSALTDSVAQKEQKALANPKLTEGVPAAKAKVEEEEEKRNFDTKMDDTTFNKEGKAGEKKTVNKTEMKTVDKIDKIVK
ncbi:hypothetical protein [Sulfurovum sp.]|uniref:hypothetical protein n=1 Tax=Sulfurovum sp. TaxID=1969726 RepID=UPI0025F3A2FD|nr:hypothetical protein [Sulfurovum sp.]